MFKYVANSIKTLWVKLIISWSWINNNSNAIIAITAIITAFLLFREIKGFQKQNVLLENTLKQEFRPIGVVEDRDKYPIFVTNNKDFVPKETQQDTTLLSEHEVFTALDSIKIVNRGMGYLIHVGYITYYSEKAIEYGIDTMLNHIKKNKIIFDRSSDLYRHKPFDLNESYNILLAWKIPLNREQYNLYAVILYKDIDGNLYCTLQTIRMTTKKDYYYNRINSKKIDKFPDISLNSFYYQFSKEDHNELYRYIKSIENDMAGGAEMHTLGDAIGKR